LSFLAIIETQKLTREPREWSDLTSAMGQPMIGMPSILSFCTSSGRDFWADSHALCFNLFKLNLLKSFGILATSLGIPSRPGDALIGSQGIPLKKFD
jgi:hypothetical protein